MENEFGVDYAGLWTSFFKKKIILFVYFWPCCVFAAAWASHCHGFSCCWAGALGHGAQWLRFPGSRAQAQSFRCTDLVALRHVDQGLNLCLLHWQVDSISLNHHGSPGLGIWRWQRIIRSFSKGRKSIIAVKRKLFWQHCRKARLSREVGKVRDGKNRQLNIYAKFLPKIWGYKAE